jgi:IS30 family transposase
LSLAEREEISRAVVADISDLSQTKLNAIARQLNGRPRKTLTG